MDSEAILKIKSAFRDLSRQFAAAWEHISAAWYAGMESAYLAEHGRLPGSDRTARLRKKRRAKVLEWASQQCGPQDRV
jgi:hypothetical protein